MKNASQSENKIWTSKSLAPVCFHNFFYNVIRFTGRQAAYILLFFVVSFYCLLPGIRRRGMHYISRRFEKQNMVRRFIHIFRMYWNFGQMLVDRSVLRILGKFEATGAAEHKKKLQELYAEHGKLILLTGHAGCWQMGISYLNFLDAPKAVVMLTDNNDVDKHSFKLRPCGADGSEGTGSEEEEITIINPATALGGSLEMLSALRNKSVLCINADRTFGSKKHTVEVDFLGGTIRLPISGYKIAATTNTPVAIVFSARTGAGKGEFWISDVLYIPENTGKSGVRGAEAFKPFAQKYAHELEKYCKDHPYQFYNFFNMWQ
ncbi:lysophospholipid acyltransferase family protein [Maridesulfovibrio hydrothermalis]|uniref:Acyltransferase n=1 Tax=Maridesulfovibrio hydrothermalis AM13 = DSM 14728 TaxID=1121451 RepID=L0RD12_9BACT|nr:lysophospholipid acyltransferase family protein [Maridesulfovibrio hydrothermalis]CCO23421.1 Acyltransferase [Maridesulfovibrio hydrothermalis AM13 = DSM 14728]